MEEGDFLKDSIEPVGIEGTKKILEQLTNCICRIETKRGFGTGFFCKIPFGKETMKILMTNHHILNDKDLKTNKKLNLSLNDDKDSLIIDLDLVRKTYFNKDYDVMM